VTGEPIPKQDSAQAAIAPAGEHELPRLLPLMRAYCDFYGADPADEGLAEMAAALIAAPDAEGMLWVARGGDGSVLGFATVGWKWSSLRAARVAVLEDLFVSPDARGQGLAGALIETCARRAAELGAPVMLWETAPDNHRAQAAYARTGATASSWLEYSLELRELE
jgi:GNAT superfamily N-acetyltransferase